MVECVRFIGYEVMLLGDRRGCGGPGCSDLYQVSGEVPVELPSVKKHCCTGCGVRLCDWISEREMWPIALLVAEHATAEKREGDSYAKCCVTTAVVTPGMLLRQGDTCSVCLQVGCKLLSSALCSHPAFPLAVGSLEYAIQFP